MNSNCHLIAVTVDHHVGSNQLDTIFTEETTDSRKLLINRPSDWASRIRSPSALWSRQGGRCDPRFIKAMRCEHQRGSSENWHLQGVLASHTFKLQFCDVWSASWVPSSCLHSPPFIGASDPKRFFFWQINSPQIVHFITSVAEC